MANSAYHPLPIGAKLMQGMHRGLYQLSGGRLGGRFGKLPILLLTTKGRKSGLARTTPLGYLPDGDDYVVIASNNGRDYPPAWFGNLTAQPEGVVQLGGMKFRVGATVADAEQRQRLWPLVLERYPNYAGYEQKTTREIPLVILRRQAEAGRGDGTPRPV